MKRKRAKVIAVRRAKTARRSPFVSPSAWSTRACEGGRCVPRASIESRTTRPRASGARACSAPRVSASVCVHCAFSPRGSAAARSSTKNRAAATKVACAMVSVVPCRLRLSVWCGSASVREKRSCSCGGEGRDDSRRSISAGTSSCRRKLTQSLSTGR
eukprot:4153295-Pleurochrysis_carterae.AAC.2